MVIGYTKAILWSDRLRHNIMTESAIQVFTDSFPSLQRTQTILVLCHNQMCKKYHYCKFLKKFGIDAEVRIHFNHICVYHESIDVIKYFVRTCCNDIFSTFGYDIKPR